MPYQYFLKWIDRLFPIGTIRRKPIDAFASYLRRFGFLQPGYKKLRKIDATQETDLLPLTFIKIENPLVSIILSSNNKFIYTYGCLKSIKERTDGVLYEAIVVDNAVTIDTVDLSNLVTNILIVRYKEHLSAANIRNAGAGKAKGKYILFLNNNTIVSEGWLKAMVDVADKDNSVGAVGVKLLYPGGKLQEAGGIVWNDERDIAWGYGNNQDPDNFEYNYLKEVDYSSAACLLVRRDLFDKIGGFDPRYTPAYFEDIDLAFSIRKLGYRVMYQPAAEITNFEGRMAGTDISQEAIKYQTVNRELFYRKWKTVIETEHFNVGKDIYLACDRSQGKKSILFIDHCVPTWDKDAGSMSTYMYLKLFIEMGFKVVFFPHDYSKREPYTTELQQMGIEVIYGAVNFNKWIKTNGKYMQYVWLARPHIAVNYIDRIKKYSRAKTLYSMVDFHYMRELRRYELENKPRILKEAEIWKKIEFYMFNKADVIITPSHKEVDAVKKYFPTKVIKDFPLYIYDSFIQENGRFSFLNRKDIMFLGSFVHPPNVDAVVFFLDEIFPVIKKELPEVRFHIVGSNPPPDISKRMREDVIVTGHVKDLTEYFQSTRVFVAPLRYGAGIKGKIISSLAQGLPVVTTTIGNEGLDLRDGHDGLIADDMTEFAMKVVRLYKDKELWENLARNSVLFVKEKFSMEAAKDRLLEILGLDNTC